MIRKATIDDVAVCEELSRIPELAISEGEYVDSAYYRACIEQDALFHVADVDSKVRGFIVGEPLIGKGSMIGMLGVEESYRRQGIGRQLIQAYEADARRRGLQWIFLVSEIDNGSDLFYNSLEYKEGLKYTGFGKDL